MGSGPDGPLMFVRYAYPPNALGYCGPEDVAALRKYAVTGVADPGVARLAQAFSGAWPYLEAISAGCKIDDPLDQRVVEAYWVGNDLLEAMPATGIGEEMAARFRAQAGGKFAFLAEGALANGLPHHSFHVFGVYPWVSLLGDERKARYALMVLDRCMIRWGRVVETDGEQASVEYQPLAWDGRRLSLGEPAQETARLAQDGVVLARDDGVGQMVGWRLVTGLRRVMGWFRMAGWRRVIGWRCTGIGSATGSVSGSWMRSGATPSGTWTW